MKPIEVFSLLHAKIKSGENLVFTNGHFLVSCKVASEENDPADNHDTPGPVPFAALKPFSKRNRGAVVLNGSAKTAPGGVEYPRPDAGIYPDYKVILKCADFIPAARVTFNVAYLSRIAAAAENDVITIEMKDAMDTLAPVRVICHTDEHVDAVLMPCRGK